VPFPLKLVRQVFKNGGCGSEAELFLLTNDTGLTAGQITSLYKKRWNVEVFHKSLKQNAGLGRSETKMERSQHNHIFASMLAFCQLEKLKMKEKLNHFALKAKLYINAIKASFQQFNSLNYKDELLIEIILFNQIFGLRKVSY
jgi:SRSO17 transposase